jgi:tryptophan synthase alpha chain
MTVARPIPLPPQARTIARRLCPLIMVGDPDLAATRHLLESCVALGIDLVELCLPFPNAFTDGETLRRAHARALQTPAGLTGALDLIRDFSGRIDIILLADYSHTIRPHGMVEICRAARDAGAAGILPHGLPPRMADAWHKAALGIIAVVGTLYTEASEDTRNRILARSSAFIYLVATYGRSGGAARAGDVGPAIAALRARTSLPVALGFGLKTGADVAAAFEAGCDIAIVGSAIAAAVEAGLGSATPLAPAQALLRELAQAVPR